VYVIVVVVANDVVNVVVNDGNAMDF